MMKSYRWQYWNKDTMTLSEFKNVFLPWRNPHNSHLQNNYFKHNELHCKKWPKQIWGILTGDNQAYSTINQMEQICKLIKDVQIKMVPTLSCTQFSADITHLLCKGNYHWMAASCLTGGMDSTKQGNLLLIFYLTILLNQNKSNRRSAMQRYFPYNEFSVRS